jgi:hypothetical protein
MASYAEPSHSGEQDLWAWYLRPGLHSIVAWPFGFLCVAGMVWGVIYALALQWDILRWNFLLWLILGWHVPMGLALLPVYFFYIALTFGATLWQWRLRSCWLVPLKLLGLAIILWLVAVLSLLVSGLWPDVLGDALHARFDTSIAVVNWLADAGVWLGFWTVGRGVPSS